MLEMKPALKGREANPVCAAIMNDSEHERRQYVVHFSAQWESICNPSP